MRSSFELVTALQYELKAAQRQPALFKSGQKYVTMKKEHAQECRRLEQQIKACGKNCTDSIRNSSMPVSSGLKARMTCRLSTKDGYAPFRQRMPVFMSGA